MTIVPSALTDVETTPGINDLWDLAHVLRTNWKTPQITRNSWDTVVDVSKTSSEQRRGLVSKPTLGVDSSLWINTQEDLMRYQMLAMRAGMARYLMPLYSDQAHITSTTISDTVLHGQIAFSRIYPGARVLIVNAARTEGEIRTVVSVIKSFVTGDAEITVDTAPSFSPVGGAMFPIIECMPRMSMSSGIVSGLHMEAKIVGQELPGKHNLESSNVPGNSTTLAAYHARTKAGVPIFKGSIDWTIQPRVFVRRDGGATKVGITQMPFAYGARPRIGYTFGLLFLSRREWWIFNLLWDFAAGRLYPFFVISPMKEFEFSSTLAGFEIGVEAVGPESDWQFRPYLAIERDDGFILVSKVVSVSRSGSNDIVTIADKLTGFTSFPTNIRRITSARLCRFERDELVEMWQNYETCRVQISVIELLEEKDIDIADLDTQIIDPLWQGFDPTACAGYI